MNQGSDNHFLEIAVSAARLAGKVVLENLDRLSAEDVGRKMSSDYVTRADRDAERVIIHTIRKKYPEHHFLAEESTDRDTSGEYSFHERSGAHFWIVDPLDGTTNFIHGYPVFSISIALQISNTIVLGVIFDPLRDELFTAEKGRGSFLNGHSVYVSGARSITECLLTTGFPFRQKDMIDPYLELFKNLFHKVSDMRRAGSAALDLAYLACGRCDGFFEIGLHPWDIAAGSLLITEAGGTVTDFEGGNAYLTSGNIVAGAPSVHREILGEVKHVFRGIVDR